MNRIILTARAGLLLAALLPSTPAIVSDPPRPHPPLSPVCAMIVGRDDDGRVCWDEAILYDARTGEHIMPLFGVPDDDLLTMLASGNYGIAVATTCEGEV